LGYLGNTYGYDTVGLDPASVQYYEQHRAPCKITIPQQMNIVTQSPLYNYYGYTITITVCKTGVIVSKQHGTLVDTQEYPAGTSCTAN